MKFLSNRLFCLSHGHARSIIFHMYAN